MKGIKWGILGYATITALSLAGIGVAVSEKSILIALGCILAMSMSIRAGIKKNSEKNTSRS